jgi:hypothetical protein
MELLSASASGRESARPCEDKDHEILDMHFVINQMNGEQMEVSLPVHRHLAPTKDQLQTRIRERKAGRAHREKAFIRVGDKKELIDLDIHKNDVISTCTEYLRSFVKAPKLYVFGLCGGL